MAEKESSDGLLETMEENQNEIQHAETPWNQGEQSVGICEHQERLLEDLQ